MDTEFVRPMARGYGTAGQITQSVQTRMTHLSMLLRNKYLQNFTNEYCVIFTTKHAL